ncbi:unnamed protein product [Moneuplotes crassus]|uniref:Uncharacterized protein n=1 Tax=Euplotes crassus TaxID=5936 RepID=A0AAD2CXE1_EUPCR|nr:unnamed protein product [Moneuplotes crassus]
MQSQSSSSPCSSTWTTCSETTEEKEEDKSDPWNKASSGRFGLAFSCLLSLKQGSGADPAVEQQTHRLFYKW